LTLWSRGELEGYLSPRTDEEDDEWQVDGPLIFFHVVEIGRLQPCPPPLYTTNPELHGYDTTNIVQMLMAGQLNTNSSHHCRYDRWNRYTEKNWVVKHDKYVMD